MAAEANWDLFQPRQKYGDKIKSAAAAPIARIHATVCGATRSNRLIAINAPMY
jgi:hypothetical protein